MWRSRASSGLTGLRCGETKVVPAASRESPFMDREELFKRICCVEVLFLGIDMTGGGRGAGMSGIYQDFQQIKFNQAFQHVMHCHVSPSA